MVMLQVFVTDGAAASVADNPVDSRLTGVVHAAALCLVIVAL